MLCSSRGCNGNTTAQPLGSVPSGQKVIVQYCLSRMLQKSVVQTPYRITHLWIKTLTTYACKKFLIIISKTEKIITHCSSTPSFSTFSLHINTANRMLLLIWKTFGSCSRELALSPSFWFNSTLARQVTAEKPECWLIIVQKLGTQYSKPLYINSTPLTPLQNNLTETTDTSQYTINKENKVGFNLNERRQNWLQQTSYWILMAADLDEFGIK